LENGSLVTPIYANIKVHMSYQCQFHDTCVPIRYFWRGSFTFFANGAKDWRHSYDSWHMKRPYTAQNKTP
jgi:hypothetical protein